jgi:hypothetical protein
MFVGDLVGRGGSDTVRAACICLVGLAGMVGAVGGCSTRTTFEVARVHGTVTLDGSPLNGAIVIFEPKGGRPSRGQTNAEGKYQLLYTVDIAGAAVGPCSVTISTAIEDNEGNVAPERVPKRYFRPGALGVEVKPRGNVCDFALTTKP